MEYRERFVPANIIRELKLQEPQFEKTAEWGHFGNGFSWE
jgi:S-adenosylmethionine synthetase